MCYTSADIDSVLDGLDRAVSGLTTAPGSLRSWKICTTPHAATMSGSAMNMKPGMWVTISSIVALPVAGHSGLATVNSSAKTVTGQCMGECGRHTAIAVKLNITGSASFEVGKPVDQPCGH